MLNLPYNSIVESIKENTGLEFSVLKGDPAALISDNSKIIKKMGWSPKYDDLGLIMKSAYTWEKDNLNG
jgi:UDP-glucose 4-epimerase